MIFKTVENGISKEQDILSECGVSDDTNSSNDSNNALLDPTLNTNFLKKKLILGGIIASGTILLFTHYISISISHALILSLFLFSFLYIFWFK